MNENATQYVQYIKPSWAPPSWLFGPVWSVLYTIIAITYGYTAWLYWQGKVPFIVVLPFLLNIVFNAAFTPIQFGLKNNILAAADILLVLATLVWALWAIWPHAPWVAYANVPYLLWVVFATALQLTVTWLNR
jgi:tryptophan-rich sensory protein